MCHGLHKMSVSENAIVQILGEILSAYTIYRKHMKTISTTSPQYIDKHVENISTIYLQHIDKQVKAIINKPKPTQTQTHSSAR